MGPGSAPGRGPALRARRASVVAFGEGTPGGDPRAGGKDEMERSGDWLAQARRDLETAAHCARGGFHEWAAFAAQQGAEKAIKAVYQRLGGDAWGHSCTQLLAGLFAERGIEREDLLDRGRLLDRFYIPARYPNGWDAGAPKDMIGERDARDAIRAAEEIVRFCEGLLA